MGEHVRLWAGSLIAALGVAMWAGATALLASAIDTRALPSVIGVDPAGQLLVWGKELRWATIALVAAGLTLTVRRAAGGLFALGFAVALLTADVLLDRFVDPRGWTAAAVLGAVTGGVAATGVFAVARHHRPKPNDHRWATLFLLGSAAVCASVVPLLWWDLILATNDLPPAMPAFVCTLGVALVVATVVNALATVRQPTSGRILGAGLVVIVAAGAVTTHGLVWLTWRDIIVRATHGAARDVVFMSATAMTPLLMCAAVLIARGVPRRWFAWVGLVVGLAFAVAAAPVVTTLGLMASVRHTWDVMTFLRERPAPLFFDTIMSAPIAAVLAFVTCIEAAVLVSLLSRPAPAPVATLPVEAP